MSKILEHECNLGDPDAQHDHQMLNEVFIKTEHYQRLLTNSACFIVGRRGAGKSALALHALKEFTTGNVFVDEESQYDLYKESIRSFAINYHLSPSQITDVAHHLWRFVINIVSLQAVQSQVDG